MKPNCRQRTEKRFTEALQRSLAHNKQLFKKQIIYSHPCENSQRTLFTRRLFKRPHDNVTRECFRCRAFFWEHRTLTGTNMLILLFVVSSPPNYQMQLGFSGHDNRTLCCHLVFYTLGFKCVLVYERKKWFYSIKSYIKTEM